MTDKDRYELKIAGLLHDCGKITTPVHVVDKSTKLQTLFDRIHLIDTRFEVLKRDAEIAMLCSARLRSAGEGRRAARHARADLSTRASAQLDDDREFLRNCNIGGENMPGASSSASKHRPANLGATRRAKPPSSCRTMKSKT